jgi:hypothetical protein
MAKNEIGGTVRPPRKTNWWPIIGGGAMAALLAVGIAGQKSDPATATGSSAALAPARPMTYVADKARFAATVTVIRRALYMCDGGQAEGLDTFAEGDRFTNYEVASRGANACDAEKEKIQDARHDLAKTSNKDIINDKLGDCAVAAFERWTALSLIANELDGGALHPSTIDQARSDFDEAKAREAKCWAGVAADARELGLVQAATATPAPPTPAAAPQAAVPTPTQDAAPTPDQDALSPAATDRAIKAAFAAASQYGGVDQASIALALAPGADVAAVIGGANAARGFCVDAPNPNAPATREACGALVRLTLRAAAFGYLYKPPMSGPQDDADAIWHKANAGEQAIIDRGIVAAATAEEQKALADMLAGR